MLHHISREEREKEIQTAWPLAKLRAVIRLVSGRGWSPEEIREAFSEPPEEEGRGVDGEGDIQRGLFAGASE